MAGSELATTFSSLRPNDLVWNYVVNNYLKGESPPPFDLLYWNADSTNLPGPMFCWYLRHMYLQNELRDSGPADRRSASRSTCAASTCPTYVLCTSEDHIVPWQAASRRRRRSAASAASSSAPAGTSPASSIRPARRSAASAPGPTSPASTRRTGWRSRPSSPAAGGRDWSPWLAKHQGQKCARRRRPAGGAYKAIEPAPGRYVKEKAA